MISSSSIAHRTYDRLGERSSTGRERLGRPITLTEKILYNHLRNPRSQTLDCGRSYADLDPDRVALQDVLAQMVALQFMTAGLDTTVVPTTLHCDHLITAGVSEGADLDAARKDNQEVYDFLRSVSDRFGIDFWEPGSGIIHQVLLENYAFPGGLMIGTDSHTPNGGGLGMISVGVGGGDAIDAMTGAPFNLRWPRIIGVGLRGSLTGWTSPKDVILRLSQLLTVSGGTGAIVEYFGEGADSFSATGKATICNMGAEIGATASVFPFDTHIDSYLQATGRSDVARAARKVKDDLRCDPEVAEHPERFFDRVVEIDLSTLQPQINGPDSPDIGHTLGDVGRWASLNGVPVEISTALIGSCTNSSYEDISRAASIARQATAHGLRARSQLLVTPGSEQVRATAERDGLLSDLEAIGATVLANACGPCIGQWDRKRSGTGADTIVTSYNRNFPGRNDGNTETKAFLASPEVVVALALAGTLEFDPTNDLMPVQGANGVRLTPPSGKELPDIGFIKGRSKLGPRPRSVTGVRVEISPSSERLQPLSAFAAWDGSDYLELPVLVKALGKCTTDQISPAGKWLRYRGHLENISGNLFSDVVNAFSGEVGSGRDPIDGEIRPYPEIARRLGKEGIRWCVVGDENYGEGSSRELAAMEPRYRGAVAVLARSYARIHETNLKKQGILALQFCEPSVYDLVGEQDRISIHELGQLVPDRPVPCTLRTADGSVVAFECTHTLSESQIGWFTAGSALNVIRRMAADQPVA